MKISQTHTGIYATKSLIYSHMHTGNDAPLHAHIRTSQETINAPGNHDAMVILIPIARQDLSLMSKQSL